MRFLLCAFLVGCGSGSARVPGDGDSDDEDTEDQVGDDDDDDTAPIGPCEGEGEAVVDVGVGGRYLFDAFEEGESLSLVEGDGGQLGFDLEFLTTGLDTREGISTVIQLTFEDDPTDINVAMLFLQCDEPTGWAGVWAVLADDRQADAASGAMAGMAVNLTVVLTDASPESASMELDLFVQ